MLCEAQAAVSMPSEDLGLDRRGPGDVQCAKKCWVLGSVAAIKVKEMGAAGHAQCLRASEISMDENPGIQQKERNDNFRGKRIIGLGLV